MKSEEFSTKEEQLRFNEKWNSLWQGQYNSKDSFLPCFNTVFMIRRMAFAIALVV